jgi:hypothetical protein
LEIEHAALGLKWSKADTRVAGRNQIDHAIIAVIGDDQLAVRVRHEGESIQG